MTTQQGNMYKIWRDATPTITFPFSFKDKNEGTISQSWKDIREKLNRDAVNTALSFCTAHIAPSGLQAHIIDESIRKEDATREHHVSTQRLRERSAANSPSRRAATPSSSSLSAAERAALYDGEGGGRSRVAFLKLRRQRNVQERFSFRQTTQQVYGWSLLDRQPPRPATSAMPPLTKVPSSRLVDSTVSGPNAENDNHSLVRPSTALVGTESATRLPPPSAASSPMSPVSSSTPPPPVAANFMDVPQAKRHQKLSSADHRRKSAAKEWSRSGGVFPNDR